jgi:2-phosphoglycerate kinase
MIYLIGGPPRCGKTSVTRKLARTIGCSWVQGDWLTQAFSAYVPDGEFIDGVHALDVGPNVPRESRNDVRYTRFTADQIIAYYRALAQQTWPGLKTLIEYALDDGEDFVVEGYQVDPALVADYLEGNPYRAAQVRVAFLVRVDHAAIATAIRTGSSANDWVVGRTQNETTFGLIARMIVQYSAVIRAEAAGLPVFSMDDDFNQRVGEVVDILLA